MSTNTNDTKKPLDRYRMIEYQREAGLVFIIQDAENDQAWIQSDVTMDLQA
jgi:hypothetical protein